MPTLRSPEEAFSYLELELAKLRGEIVGQQLILQQFIWKIVRSQKEPQKIIDEISEDVSLSLEAWRLPSPSQAEMYEATMEGAMRSTKAFFAGIRMASVQS